MKPLILGVVLAVASFGFARYQYLHDHTVSIKGVGSATIASNDLFGNWVKDQWIFAIAVPVGLIVGGAALSMKK